MAKQALGIVLMIFLWGHLPGQNHRSFCLKVQLPGFVSSGIGLLSPAGSKPSPSFLVFDLEKEIGNSASLLLMGGFRSGRDEKDPIPNVGQPFWEASGWKLGFGFRKYLGESEPLHGSYLQPVLNFWQGSFFRFTGDSSDDSERWGTSVVAHFGYQLLLNRHLLLDGSGGLGLGWEQVEGDLEDRFNGFHYANGNRGGVGFAFDLRLALGWVF